MEKREKTKLYYYFFMSLHHGLDLLSLSEEKYCIYLFFPSNYSNSGLEVALIRTRKWWRICNAME